MVPGAADDDVMDFYGGILVCESIQPEVAKMIIADHEFCQSLTESDRSCFRDLVWWLKGFKAGAEGNLSNCPFDDDHLKALEKLVRNMGSILK